MRTRSIRFLAILATAALVESGCHDSPTSESALDSRAGNNVCLGEDGEPLPIAPRSARVDLGKPTFSNPTSVTNPLFPISSLSRVILLGHIDGKPFRVETTLLPETRIIDLRPRPVATLVSQYAAWIDGRIEEVALDFYAQADDGAAWYFGEDVFNYEDGIVADIDGTWLAGRDGPAAMIMPANPKVGDVWRPENICGFVFEEVTAKQINVTVPGPQGPVSGALIVQELHMDATYEDKTFAPGYGEFSTGSAAGDLEAVALAVPTDALPGPLPGELVTLEAGAAVIFDAAQSADWSLAASTLAAMTSAWNSFKSGSLPPMLQDQMDVAMAKLVAGVNANDPAASRQASIEVERANLDFELRHRPRNEIDLALLANWGRQLLVHAAVNDEAGVLSDVASLNWIRDRLADDATDPDLIAIDRQLESLRLAAGRRDIPGITAAAGRLQTALARSF